MKTSLKSVLRAASAAGLACAFAAALAAPAFAAVTAHLTASPTNFVGPCPAVITFTGKIKSTTQGAVQYKFTRSDGAIAPVQTLVFRAPGVQTVSTTWTLGGLPALPNYVGWQAIEIISPTPGTSNHADFKIACVAATNP